MNQTGKLLLASLLGLLGLSRPALAQLEESPQHFAIELKFGPYSPHLDDAAWLNGKTPFSDHFGNQDDPKGARPRYGLLSQVEFDYQFWNKFGSLGIGLEGGYYSVSAPAFTVFGVTDSKGNVTQQSCQIGVGDGNSRRYFVPGGGANLDYSKDCTSGDTDKFNVVPLALMLIYRFDVLDKRFRIPLIPYVKVGLAYYFWWFGNSNAFTAQYAPAGGGDRQNAAGGSLGVVIHPGLALDLSAIDPRAARSIDQEIGLNRVAAFVELNAAIVDGFHGDHVMNLSDTIVSAGLSFEF